MFWTLTIEVAFYVALPFLALVGLRLGPKRTGAHAAFLLALVAATFAWKWLDRAGDWGEIPGKVLPAYLGHFALGMLAALWLAHRAREGRAEWTPRATALMAATGLAIVVRSGLLARDRAARRRGQIAARDAHLRGRIRADRRGRGSRPRRRCALTALASGGAAR